MCRLSSVLQLVTSNSKPLTLNLQPQQPQRARRRQVPRQSGRLRPLSGVSEEGVLGGGLVRGGSSGGEGILIKDLRHSVRLRNDRVTAVRVSL